MKRLSLLALVALVVAACGGSKKAAKDENVEVVNLDTLVVDGTPKRSRYNPSDTRKHDLLHTELRVKFDWSKRYLYGKAYLTLKPYFYATNEVTLDAKGMDINKVALMNGEQELALKFDYDSLFLRIYLDREYKRSEEYKIFIDYTAKPEELPEGGSSAITSDKGLYFINHDGADPNKPKQIWTQGETEASSCWFPTLDAPNERCTQEMFITVDKKYVTLSNGVLNHSEENPDGTRTDNWVMKKPHAPYLFMMAVGDFAIIKDSWRDSVDVHYYVEHEYADVAKQIFGKTPKMMEFYSNRLGVDFPWPKYHQIVVRDYVSGAMENTSAVIHGDFLQRTKRELIDGNGEDIVAHELFHHWFGDLVTCESWANLPLNESFATYGEYMWNEFDGGREAADRHGQSDLSVYLSESRMKQEELIRFDYQDKEDMFDGHSYQKGGRVLHMLRKLLGDEAFFAGLKKYLMSHKYSDVEMHELRIAMEDVTGLDLNWFFNQWFYASGHPELKIKYEWLDSLKVQRIYIEQIQDFENTPVYRLPVDVDFYNALGKAKRERIVIDKHKQEFDFPFDQQPALVNFDAEKMLLCVKEDDHSKEEFVRMYNWGPLYMDRYEALEELSKKRDSLSVQTMIAGLDDPYWALRRFSIRRIKRAAGKEKEVVKEKLISLAQTDKKAGVRASAVNALGRYYKNDDILPLLDGALKDSSYNVISSALGAYNRVDGDKAIKKAKEFEKENSSSVKLAIANIYVDHGGKEEHAFFQKNVAEMSSFNRYIIVQAYGKYLVKQDDATIEAGLPTLKDASSGGGAWWMKLAGISALSDISDLYGSRIHNYEEDLADMKAGDPKELDTRNNLEKAKAQKAKVKAIMDELKKTETNPNILRILERS